MVKKYVLFLAVMLFMFSFVSATFTLGNYSIEKTYAQGDYLKGWLNFSTSNEIATAQFTSDYGLSIGLFDFLNKTNANKDCIPINCNKGYSASNPGPTKLFDLNNGNSRKKIMGFKLTGTLYQEPINSAKFTMTSGASNSCVHQLEVDIFDDGVIDSGNSNAVSVSCPSTKSYGCYQDSLSTGLLILDIACQRIELSVSPAFEVGALIQRDNDGKRAGFLKMEVIDAETLRQVGERCNLATETLGLGESKELSCTINHLNTKKKDYYVCIDAETGADISRYKIKEYSPSGTPACGFVDNPSSSVQETRAFRIFAEGKQFGPVGTTEINGELSSGELFDRMVKDYVFNQYKNNCTLGCVIPLTFKGASVINEQTITLTNGEIVYKLSDRALTSTNNFYEVSESPAAINSKFQKINLNNLNISLPSEYGNYTFELKYNGNVVFSEKIVIAQIPIINSLFPTQVPAAVDRTFEVNATSPNNLNLVSYKWDFGNGDKKATTTNTISYKYNTTGNFPLTVTVIDSNGYNATKTFNVISGSPKDVANKTLEDKLNQLQSVNSDVDSYDDYTKRKIDGKLNLTNIGTSLTSIKRRLTTAGDDDEIYIDIVNELVKIKVPLAVLTSESDDSKLMILNKDKIDVNVLNEINQDKKEDISESAYEDAIYSWYFDNIETKLSYKKIKVFYEDSNETLISVVTLNVKKLDEDLSDEVYLVLKDYQNLEFKEVYIDKPTTNSVYIKLPQDQQDITFSTTDAVDFYDIDAFVSTSLTNLKVLAPERRACVVNNQCEADEGENWKNCFSDCKPWGMIIWIVVGLLIFFFIAYIIMQEWYKRNYENHLFKNKNFLFNILSYIHNEKLKGRDDSTIDSNLKKSGWNSEQVRYAMRKYYGKRTGMLEVPMDWFFNIFSKNKMPHYDRQMMPSRRY